MNQQKNQQKNQTKQNYQKILDRTIEELQQLQRVPTLLLHSCCAPSLTMYWSICQVFSNCSVILRRIFIRMKSIKKEWQSKEVHQTVPGKNRISFIEGRFNKRRFLCDGKRFRRGAGRGGERCFCLLK